MTESNVPVAFTFFKSPNNTARLLPMTQYLKEPNKQPSNKKKYLLFAIIVHPV